eukprot:872967-Ditylum_brightwellii.AAC.1
MLGFDNIKKVHWQKCLGMSGKEVVSLSYPAVVLAKDDMLQNYHPLLNREQASPSNLVERFSQFVEGCVEDTCCNDASSEVTEWLNQTLLVTEEEGKMISRRGYSSS